MPENRGNAVLCDRFWIDPPEDSFPGRVVARSTLTSNFEQLMHCSNCSKLDVKVLNVGALIIRIGLGGILYYIHFKEPPHFLRRTQRRRAYRSLLRTCDLAMVLHFKMHGSTRSSQKAHHHLIEECVLNHTEKPDKVNIP